MYCGWVSILINILAFPPPVDFLSLFTDIGDGLGVADFLANTSDDFSGVGLPKSNPYKITSIMHFEIPI